MGSDSAGERELRKALVSQLRWALRRLYDPDALRKSPLFPLFELDAERDGLALQRILLEGIAAMKPDARLPQQGKAWRAYRALYHRYTEQFAQAEVARTLGLSPRQLHRQEIEALVTLASRLCTQYNLWGRAADLAPVPKGNAAHPGIPNGVPSREEEMRRLAESLPSDAAMADEVLQAALKVALPLSQALQVRLGCELSPALAHVAVKRGVVRHAVLSALTAAMRIVPGGTVQVRCQAWRNQVQIDLLLSAAAGSAFLDRVGLDENLDMARRLLAMCGGVLEVHRGAAPDRPFSARLTVPGAGEATVLVVDDNADALRLFERYLDGSHFRFVGTSDPQRVLALATQLNPLTIVLDVMLPGVDGWELLGNLREEPDTHHIPVIVCSILPEEPLALALGASGFIRKPVSQLQFLAALDQQASSLAQDPPE